MPETIKQLEETKVALSCAEVLEAHKSAGNNTEGKQRRCATLNVVFLATQKVPVLRNTAQRIEKTLF